MDRDYEDQVVYVVEVDGVNKYYPVIPDYTEENNTLALEAAKKFNEGAQIYTLDADGINKTPFNE
jgi:hypothetical protein